MKTIEFELERTIRAPIDQVFARLIDFDGYGEWMTDRASMLTRTRQTSPGSPTVGTTYVDETSRGALPGEIVEFGAPHTVVFHWWDKSKKGKTRFEGWPGYALHASGQDATTVRHHAKLSLYGIFGLAAPVFKRLALQERTVTIDALKASFEPSQTDGA